MRPTFREFYSSILPLFLAAKRCKGSIRPAAHRSTYARSYAMDNCLLSRSVMIFNVKHQMALLAPCPSPPPHPHVVICARFERWLHRWDRSMLRLCVGFPRNFSPHGGLLGCPQCSIPHASWYSLVAPLLSSPTSTRCPATWARFWIEFERAIVRMLQLGTVRSTHTMIVIAIGPPPFVVPPL